MTPLGEKLIQRIEATGPMTLAEYMTECLFDPTHGYYTTRDPLGTGGDFTTAPEISQMFGELLGLALAQTWLDQGGPSTVSLVELGPGRGTLMADVLRATAAVPGFHTALTVHLVETSRTLRIVQSENIEHPVTHHDSLATVPVGPILLIANEFFDALPIRQFQRDGEGWRERVVGLREGKLSFGISDPMPPTHLVDRLEGTMEGDVVEVSAASTSNAQEIGQRISTQGGAALVVDYGGWRSIGDTFQAVQDHQPTDPFEAPGEADLTAHVDFEALKHAASPAAASQMVTQGILLERLGITSRAEKLARNLSGDALRSHIEAHRRLTHPDEMGTLFKAMALFPAGMAPPPGFDLA